MDVERLAEIEAWGYAAEPARSGRLVLELVTEVRFLRNLADGYADQSQAWRLNHDEMRTELLKIRNSITELADEWEQEQPIGIDGKRWTSHYPEQLRALLAPVPRESKG